MRPSRPTKVERVVVSGTMPVEALEDPRWDEDYDAWVCRYRTLDPNIMPEFREWTAVFNGTTWEPVEL